jgi:hypothetical protein
MLGLSRLRNKIQKRYVRLLTYTDGADNRRIGSEKANDVHLG